MTVPKRKERRRLLPIEHGNFEPLHIIHANLTLQNKFILPVGTSNENSSILPLKYTDLERVERHQVPDVYFFLLAEADDAAA